MRTTISLDGHLLDLAKQRARERRTTLGKVVEEALRAALTERAEEATQPFELVTFHGDGPQEGIDLDRTSALLAAEDVMQYARGGKE
jgi:carbamate kinase